MTGVITQLTELPSPVYGATRVDEATGEVYFGYDPDGGPCDTDG